MYRDEPAVNPGKVILLTSCELHCLSVIVGRQLRHQERKLLSHINARKELLSHVRVAVRIREDDIDDLARTTQGGGSNIHSTQRLVARECVSCVGIDSRIAHCTV